MENVWGTLTNIAYIKFSSLFGEQLGSIQKTGASSMNQQPQKHKCSEIYARRCSQIGFLFSSLLPRAQAGISHLAHCDSLLSDFPVPSPASLWKDCSEVKPNHITSLLKTARWSSPLPSVYRPMLRACHARPHDLAP